MALKKRRVDLPRFSLKHVGPVHPGRLLRDHFMGPMRISQNQLAKDLNVPVTRIGEIVNSRRAVTGETALRLARYFGQSAQFWLHLQAQYDREIAEDDFGEKVAAEVQPRAARASGRQTRDKCG